MQMLGILIFLIIFGILVVVHEFGHFIVAKKSGILVREFSVGMGPKLFQKLHKNTTYTVRWLPLGGYVRLAGPDDTAKIDPGSMVLLQLNEKGQVVRINTTSDDISFDGIPVQVKKADLEDTLYIEGFENGDEEKLRHFDVIHDATIIEENGTELQIAPRDVQMQSVSVWKKIATNFAGPFNNALLTLVVFMIYAFVSAGAPTTVVNNFSQNSPAQTAGIEKGDKIVKVDQQNIASTTDIQQYLSTTKNEQVTVEIERNGQSVQKTVTPQTITENETNYRLLGLTFDVDGSFSARINQGWNLTTNTATLIFKGVKSLVTGFSLNKLSGPVGIYKQASDLSNQGFLSILYFLGAISINLGIMNLLPIPGLDGGKLLLNLYELLRGKPVSQEKEVIINIVGVVILFALIIAVTGNDIYRYFIK
ncbi:M50 family peptidase [Holzapfeliella floricola DSM 23037 = JCM 16512]|uniref:Zinc metalloprotease n=2 Tax=Holzapfeliella TaxID=2767883 RepID=A0A0R2DI85_9LACO|nr:M50 family peptidase [Holzapfeliella floricola DSM 23037 = JCM 16512]